MLLSPCFLTIRYTNTTYAISSYVQFVYLVVFGSVRALYHTYNLLSIGFLKKYTIYCVLFLKFTPNLLNKIPQNRIKSSFGGLLLKIVAKKVIVPHNFRLRNPIKCLSTHFLNGSSAQTNRPMQQRSHPVVSQKTSYDRLPL